jgi:hypothetical protein
VVRSEGVVVRSKRIDRPCNCLHFVLLQPLLLLSQLRKKLLFCFLGLKAAGRLLGGDRELRFNAVLSRKQQ